MGAEAIRRYEEAADKMSQDIELALAALDDAREFCEGAVKGIEVANEEQIQELVRIRFLLKDTLRADKEKCEDARERLERVLDELDSSWRALA